MANPLLADAVDVRRWLAQDADQPLSQRVARDRAIGAELDQAGDLQRVLAWWAAVQPARQAGIGARLVRLRRLATVLLIVLGLVLGVGLGSVAFAYDGTHPVNLLALLGVLVGVPLLLGLLTLLLLLPGRVPGLSALRESVSVLNPARWAGSWLDRVSGLALYGGFSGTRSALTRWQLVVFSQWLATGIFVGVLATGWILVAVTDLAFGWTTTLTLEPEAVFGLFETLAQPWAGWLPAAVPDLTLVEVSRYYRLETDLVSEARAVELGAWWPFVLMCVLTYGLTPRLVLLVLGSWRLSSATRAMICQDPEVLALLDRLNQPRVAFVQESEISPDTDPTAVPDPPPLIADPGTVLLIWNQAIDAQAARHWLETRLGTSGGRVLAAGTRSSPDDLARSLAEPGEPPQRMVIFSKGWEPPLLEFADFIGSLRELIGAVPTITVVPVDTSGRGIDAADREVWARFLARQEDPRLYVFQATDDDGVPEADR